MTRSDRLKLEVSTENDGSEVVAYLTLPDHASSVARNVRLRDLLGDYKGPDLYFDFDEDNTLVGIEILD